MVNARSWLPFLVAAAIQTGCVCWFVPCDRGFCVSGRVVDGTGRPVAGAMVTVFDSETVTTDANGCFQLEGFFATPRLDLSVVKPKYVPFHQRRRMGYYGVLISLRMLREFRGEQIWKPSSAEWREFHDENAVPKCGTSESEAEPAATPDEHARAADPPSRPGRYGVVTWPPGVRPQGILSKHQTSEVP
jgi:Carboxypeptidase regulatory-like domain